MGAARHFLGLEHRARASTILCLSSTRPPLGVVHSVLLTSRHSLASSAGRGRGSAVPRVGEIESCVRVLEVHAQHESAMKPIDVSGCWNRLGKLARSDREQRRSLQRALKGSRRRIFQPLLETTVRLLPRAGAREMASTVHGIGTLVDKVGFRAGGAIFDEVAEASRSRVVIISSGAEVFSSDNRWSVQVRSGV